MNGNDRITRVLFTGGPGGGKSSCALTLYTKLRKKFLYGGIVIPFLISETQRELLESGIDPYIIGRKEFNRLVLHHQIEKEAMFMNVANQYIEHPRDPGFQPLQVCLIYDRGIPDISGYIPDMEYDDLLKEKRITKEHVMNGYDKIIFISSNAGNPNLPYARTEIRYESRDNAFEIDKKLFQVYKEHIDLRFGFNYRSMEDKVSDIMKTLYEEFSIRQ